MKSANTQCCFSARFRSVSYWEFYSQQSSSQSSSLRVTPSPRTSPRPLFGKTVQHNPQVPQSLP